MVTSAKEFAPRVSKNEHGWYTFPKDISYRKSLFPQEVFQHPAKANCYLIEALVDYLTKPGDSIIDPFGGTGTLLLAARRGRKVVLIDVEEQFVELQKKTLANWRQDSIELADTFIYHGDSRQVLQQIQYQCDAAIFSPPYWILQGGYGFKGDAKQQAEEYGGKEASALNLGRLNAFMFTQAIDKVYERLSARLVPSAPVAILTKDTSSDGKRIFTSEPNINRAQRHGLKLESWFKWRPPGSKMKAIMKAQGSITIDDEDILVFRKV